MTGGTAKPRLRFWRVDLVADWAVELPVEEHGMVVTSCTPFGRFGSDNILHVLNRFSVPLVIERREVVNRGIPLVIDVTMTAPARLTCQKKI